MVVVFPCRRRCWAGGSRDEGPSTAVAGPELTARTGWGADSGPTRPSSLLVFGRLATPWEVAPRFAPGGVMQGRPAWPLVLDSEDKSYDQRLLVLVRLLWAYSNR